MKKFLLYPLLFLLPLTGFSQSKSKPSATDQALINQLLNELQTNPDNPLKIDQQLLKDIAGKLPEGNLKSTLQSYSINLGTDKNLSMRQIYSDLNVAFNTNSQLASLAQYQSTGKSLDLLINNSQSLVSSIKGGAANYQPGMFMSDPYFITNMQQTLGIKYDDAAALGVGVELAMAFVNEYKKKQHLKENYPTYAAMSSQMVYPEVDKHLSGALIDAYVGRNPGNMLTSLYRYDFANGATIRAEKGILRFMHSANKIDIPLVSIENRNDGNYLRVKTPVEPLIIVPTNEKRVMLYTGSIVEESSCSNCLQENRIFTLDVETGKITKLNIMEFRDFYGLTSLYGTTFDGDTLHYVSSTPIAESALSSTRNDHLFTYKIEATSTKRGSFTANETILDRSYKWIYPKSELVVNEEYLNPNVYHVQHRNHILSLYWGLAKKESAHILTSAFDINQTKGKYSNADGMQNELTGIVVSKNGILFYTTADGKVGSMDLKKEDLGDPSLISKMRSRLVNSGLETYDFTVQKSFLFESVTHKPRFNAPSLTLTPDEKHLVYIVNNKLHLIEVAKLNQHKKFTMTIDPFHNYFAKENGRTTLYVQAVNEFKFPVAKKYYLDQLINAKIEAPVVKTTPKTSSKTTTKSVKDGSVADELKKLKSLLDEGAITQQEYEIAKKKVLAQ